jgi:hypothetical protein
MQEVSVAMLMALKASVAFAFKETHSDGRYLDQGQVQSFSTWWQVG